jgi:hypothetical protein
MLDAYELLTGSEAPVGPRLTPPGQPIIGSPTVGSTSVTVRWSPPLFDGGSPVTGYTVHTFRAQDLAWVRSTDAPATARGLTVGGLTNGTAYRFVVDATNAQGTGNISQWTAAVAPRTVPSAARIGTPSAANAAAVVRWAAPTSNGGSGITGYAIRAYRGTTVVRTVTAAGTSTSATVTGLANGVAYTFTVTAVNAAGAGPSSARSVAVVPKTRPGPPRIGTPTPGRAAALVRWAAPASNGGATISGYVVRAYRGATLVRTVGARSNVRAVTVTGLRPGAAHTFTVTAVNAVGHGTPSAHSSRVVPRR